MPYPVANLPRIAAARLAAYTLRKRKQALSVHLDAAETKACTRFGHAVRVLQRAKLAASDVVRILAADVRLILHGAATSQRPSLLASLLFSRLKTLYSKAFYTNEFALFRASGTT